jgi:hypothetical protein
MRTPLTPEKRYAVNAVRVGNSEIAMRLWRPLADNGLAVAQFNLGLTSPAGPPRGLRRYRAECTVLLHSRNRQAADCYRKVIEFIREHPDHYDPGFEDMFTKLVKRLDPPVATCHQRREFHPKPAV